MYISNANEPPGSEKLEIIFQNSESGIEFGSVSAARRTGMRQTVMTKHTARIRTRIASHLVSNRVATIVAWPGWRAKRRTCYPQAVTITKTAIAALAAVYFTAPPSLQAQKRAPQTHRLEATPSSIAYGYYWSEAKPALRIAS